MAGKGWVAIPDTVDVMTGTTPMTCLQVQAPAAQDIEIEEWGITCGGVSATDPELKVLLQVQSGSAALGSGVTMRQRNPLEAASAINTAARYNINSSTQPTPGDPITPLLLAPNGGGYHYVGKPIRVARGTKVGIVVDVGAGASIPVRPYMKGSE